MKKKIRKRGRGNNTRRRKKNKRIKKASIDLSTETIALFPSEEESEKLEKNGLAQQDGFIISVLRN